MLDLVDLDRQISKEQYDEVFPNLETRLGELQRTVRETKTPVVVVFDGWDAAGKGTLMNRFALTLDPRGFKVRTNGQRSEEERLRPWLWQYWNELPAAGEFVFFDRSWYRQALEARVADDSAHLNHLWQDIRVLERQLTDSGVVIVKFWLHIGREEQKKRFNKLLADGDTAWRVGKREKRQNKLYPQWLAAAEEMLEETSTPNAPWTILEATQERYARVKAFETLLGAVDDELERRRAAPNVKPEPMPEPPAQAASGPSVLDRADLSLTLDRETYDREREELGRRLFELEHRLYIERVPAVIVYEGWDAGGKGGNIRRLVSHFDPRGYEVIPVAAPTEEEKAHHYLWRFWRNVPKAGHIALFDRSWYGRVMVERVEGFCTEDQWRRAYQEINEFERQLADFGTVIVKFWLQIDQAEQLRRFESRQQEKQWKITEEDWRNRAKWKQYERAVVDMIERTSTRHAPWTILEANDKLYARIKAQRTLAEAIEARLSRPT